MPPKQKIAPAVFTDRDESYDIETTLNNIQSQRHLYKLDELRQMHHDFATENPELFKKCSTEQLTRKDYDYVVFLLETRRKVKTGEMSFQQANQKVATYFAKAIQPELLSKDGFGKK